MVAGITGEYQYFEEVKEGDLVFNSLELEALEHLSPFRAFP